MTVADDKHCFFTQDGLTEGRIAYNAYVSYIVEIFLCHYVNVKVSVPVKLIDIVFLLNACSGLILKFLVNINNNK